MVTFLRIRHIKCPSQCQTISTIFLTGLILPLCFLHCLFDSSSGRHKSCVLTCSWIPSLAGRSNALTHKPFFIHYRPKLVSNAQRNWQKERQLCITHSTQSLRALCRRLQHAHTACPSTSQQLSESLQLSVHRRVCVCHTQTQTRFFIGVEFTKHSHFK